MQNYRLCLSVLECLYHVGPRTLPFYIKRSRFTKMQIIYEEILPFRVFPQEYLQMSDIKLWLTHSLSRTLSALWETLKKKSTRPLTAAEWPIWEVTPEPLWQTHCGRVTSSPRAPASSLAASIFHRCSLVSSNFRIFSKWFSSCQLGTVQGAQLGELSRVDQSKAACVPNWD